MAINKGIIQVRRGLKEDLQSDKLLPGELAIATDAPCMWFCWSPGNVEQLPTSDNVIDVIIETVNQYLANNDITVISDGFMRVYDGWIQYSADNKTWKNVIAVSELIGENGGYYTPEVTDNGDLTWTPSSAGMEPLPSVNIRGPEAELTKESVENALGYAPLKSADVVDNLLGNSGKLPLSDKQGKVLDEKISELNTNLSNKLNIAYQLWGKTLTFSMKTGTHAFVMANNCAFMVWMSGSGLSATPVVGNTSAITFSNNGNNVTVNATSDHTITAYYISA